MFGWIILLIILVLIFGVVNDDINLNCLFNLLSDSFFLKIIIFMLNY